MNKNGKWLNKLLSWRRKIKACVVCDIMLMDEPESHCRGCPFYPYFPKFPFSYKEKEIVQFT